MLPVLQPAQLGRELAACTILGAAVGVVRAFFPVRGRGAFVPDALLTGAVLFGVQKKIVENTEAVAEAEKAALDEKFDKKRMDFDKELEADTQRQIQEIRDKLESETSRILSGQSQESQDELDALQKEYDEKHSDYAHEILRRITEV